jgi:hypothetical protein
MTFTEEQIKQLVDSLNAETAREVIRISLSIDENLALTDSKLGGLPYIPKEGTLPTTSQGEPLFMLAQINCDQLPENSLYPKKGLLQFWIASDEYYGADFENRCQNETKRICYFPEIQESLPVEYIKELYTKISASKRKTNNIFTQENALELPFNPNQSLALGFEKSVEGISYADVHFDDEMQKIWEAAFSEEFPGLWGLPEEVLKVFYKYLSNGAGHKIGGYPDFAQYDPREDDDFHDILLLQIESEWNEQYSVMFGDAGVANFFINREDLAHCKFDDVLYNWDCS